MKEVIQTIDGRDVLRITYEHLDQRFYYDEDQLNVRTGTPWKPSATYILGHMPRNKFLDKWIGDKGHEEAERIKTKAGDLGRFVHESIDRMIRGEGEERIVKSIEIDTDLSVKDSTKVKRCLQGFVAWWNKYQPKPVHESFDVEKSIDGGDWMGTGDLRCLLNVDDYANSWLVDFKTSNSIWMSHRVQVAGYCVAAGATRAGILHLGNKTKQRYTWSEVTDILNYSRIFDSVKETFYLMGEYTSEGPALEPKTEDFPEFFAL